MAHVLGYAVSIVCSFLLNSYVTCRTKPTWRGFVRYPVSSLANLVASGALLYGAVTGLGMDKNLAALAAGVIVTPVSFLLARWAIMSGRRDQAAAAKGTPDVPQAPGAPEASTAPEAPTTPQVSAPDRSAQPPHGRPVAADRPLAPRATASSRTSVRSSEDR